MMNYPPYYQPGYQPCNPPMMDNLAQLRTQQAVTNPMIWVQGEAAAKSYLVAAGNTIPLWDSENMCIYVKSVDASGVPSMRILDYTERAKPVPAHTLTSAPEYVTREEFDALAAQIAALTKKPSKKTEVIENE